VPDFTDALHAALSANGYIILRSQLNGAVLDQAREEIGGLLAEADWARDSTAAEPGGCGRYCPGPAASPAKPDFRRGVTAGEQDR
jgi:hypothetical protein